MPTQMTMIEFCKTHKLSFRFTEVTPSRKRSIAYHVGARHFRCFVRRKGYAIGCTYSMGAALEDDPKIQDFMQSVALDAQCADGVSFQEYCDDVGANNDSINDYRIYLACKKMAEKLKVLLGQTAYNELLQIEQE